MNIRRTTSKQSAGSWSTPGAAGVLEREEAELADRAKSILKEFPANVYRKCLLELVDYLIEREK